LFMPFTKLVWALIFMTVFGCPTVLSLIENNFNLKNVLKDFDALFIGWAMILEQSHLRATNYKGRGPLYCYCSCVLLAILILSNAYKGDNIKTLTKSFEVVPLTHMDQVVKAGYTRYSTGSCQLSALNLLAESFGDNICLATLRDKKTERRSNLTDEKIELWTTKNFKVLGENQNEEMDQNSLEKCAKTAYLGWRSVLEPMQKKLLKKHVKEKVHLGHEFLYTRRSGWQLQRYGTVKVLKRMWTLVESGVYNELRNLSYKHPAGTRFKPQQVKIDGNIFVQFLYHSSGLLLALLFFIAECLTRIIVCLNSVRMIFCFLVRNFLIQTRKALLRGKKMLYEK